jgi:hypothetical protein
MKTDWLFQEPIDLEHKQYVLLDYLQKLDKNLNNLKLYPQFQEISLHLASINLLIEKGQYLIVNDTVSISAVQNPKNIDPKQGLFFLDYKDKTLLYEFVIKPIKRGSLETKCQIKKICECSKSDFNEKLKEVKNTLIKNLQNEDIHSKLIVFNVNHSNDYPLKETLLPIVKRKIMNYVIQSKIIRHKNLTSKI